MDTLRFVVTGSVDDGKSTLIGRLLFEGNALSDDQIAAVQKATRNGSAIDFSYFTDGLLAEREQGITIDVAYRYFSTPRRKYIVADTPGHQQYTRNMATGASTAQVAVLLIDARLGILPQSRRHACIASLLGIPRLAVAVNKMDLVGFESTVFEKISGEFRELVSGLGFEEVTFIPISATLGDNVVQRSARTPDYRGPTVFEYLENVPVASAQSRAPFRFPVQLVVRPDLDYRGFAGQLASGRVRVGDEVIALPSRQRSTVKAIDGLSGPLQEAAAPQSVTLRLADEIDLSRGELLAHPDSKPQTATSLEASLVWLGEQPQDDRRELILQHGPRRTKARIAELYGRLLLDSFREEPARALEKNDIGRARIECQRPLFVDSYRENRSTGAFILVDALSNETVAAGMIRKALSADARSEPVSERERRARFGHAGAVLSVQSEDAALRTERLLFDRGLFAIRAANLSDARTLAAAGLFAIVEGPGGIAISDPSRAVEDLGALID